MNRRSLIGSLAATALAQQTRPVRLGIIGSGNRGTSMLDVALSFGQVQVSAVCDLLAANTSRAVDRVQTKRGTKPIVHAGSAEAYKQLLDRQDVDAVLVATPEQTHARISIEALRRGKAVLSEVAAAVTVEECWELVETVERTRGFYMMAENCCYYRSNLALGRLLKSGLLGEITYADCAYLHSLPGLGFRSNGTLTWRGELMRDQANWYPTHAIGPVSQWLGEGLAEIMAVASPSTRISEWTKRKFGPGSEAAQTRYPGDAISAMLRTVSGRLVELKLDTISARPTASTTHYAVQGTKGAYRDVEGVKNIWLEGVHPENAWGAWPEYEQRFDDPRWQQFGTQALGSGHGGADWFTWKDFLDCYGAGKPSPIGVADAVEWSSLIALSTQSLKAGGKWLPIPRFRRG